MLLGMGWDGVPWGRETADLTSPPAGGAQSIGLQLDGEETQYPMGGSLCAPEGKCRLVPQVCTHSAGIPVLRDHNADSQINNTIAG